jgi:hypothetical protein
MVPTTLDILDEAHESEIHVQLLVAVKKSQPGVVGYEIYIHLVMQRGRRNPKWDLQVMAGGLSNVQVGRQRPCFSLPCA